jgi:hypothetical protein
MQKLMTSFVWRSRETGKFLRYNKGYEKGFTNMWVGEETDDLYTATISNFTPGAVRELFELDTKYEQVPVRIETTITVDE